MRLAEGDVKGTRDYQARIREGVGMEVGASA